MHRPGLVTEKTLAGPECARWVGHGGEEMRRGGVAEVVVAVGHLRAVEVAGVAGGAHRTDEAVPLPRPDLLDRVETLEWGRAVHDGEVEVPVGGARVRRPVADLDRQAVLPDSAEVSPHPEDRQDRLRGGVVREGVDEEPDADRSLGELADDGRHLGETGLREVDESVPSDGDGVLPVARGPGGAPGERAVDAVRSRVERHRAGEI